MSGTPPDADSQGFTCSALLMCLYLPGLSKKKPEVEASAATSEAVETSPAPVPASAANEPAEQGGTPAAYAPSRAASLEKSECASVYSGKNIVFDFVEEAEGYHQVELGRDLHGGYCPSPCFDLPVELIRAGERFGVVAGDDSHDAPVTAAFVFADDDGHRGGALHLQKMASCLAPGGEGEGEGELRSPHLVRFLSAASGRSSSVARPPVMVMPSRGAASQGMVVDGHCELGDGACV
ncbi:hypothetical protein HU200_025821 [Digitaria exilis]|uniref:Uncharacterized protein n=1 Tax=Digitaria exilis TaxID=1010633 RepID=A0A835EXA8_9POAL|nr:hypothetical protein HU200_025821 [Digitaria exilis]CAB3478578.1 unnamed protein product [Digitaria exilis]